MARSLFSVALMVVGNVSFSTHVSGICRKDGCPSRPLMMKSTVICSSPMFGYFAFRIFVRIYLCACM